MTHVNDSCAAAATTATATNATTAAADTFENEAVLRQYCVPGLMLLCAASVAVNLRILAAVFWIRRPLSPTLHISLSLAVADTTASVYLGVGLAVNSLLTGSDPLGVCGALVLEALRETSVIVTVAHLLALAANHYLGILRPLHYLAIMTHRITAVCIALLWLLPAVFFFSYFSLVTGQGFQDPCCDSTFLRFSKFRMVFSSLFFGPLVLMVFIYTHIFLIVRRHQRGRLRFSRLNQSYGGGHKQQHQHHQMARNVKAIYTTLLILGSYVVGLMPAVLVFVLICDDCLFPFQTTSHGRRNMFFVYVFVNLLVILKTLLNPIIYAARMQEIKAATKRMCGSARRHLLGRGGSSDRYVDTTCGTVNSDVSQLRHLSANGGSVVYRMRSFKSSGGGASAGNSIIRSSSIRCGRNNCQSVAL